MPNFLKRLIQIRTVSSLAMAYFRANVVELIPLKYSVTTFILKFKLNFIIVNPQDWIYVQSWGFTLLLYNT